MLWRSAYLATLSIGIFTSSSSAFVPLLGDQRSSQDVFRTSKLHVSGMGWDNDDFLSSLSQGEEAQAKANERYRAMSRFPVEDDLDEEMTAGAELTEEMKAKIKASHQSEEDSSQGGEMFRKLMERAQENNRMMPPPPSPQMQAPSFENMSVEEQARMFREMMQRQQQGGFAPPPPLQQQFYEPPQGAKNYMGPGIAEDGRKMGRNRDADAIVNSADLYFAQLKRDSSVRNTARYAGDEEYANQVFADPSLQEIKLHVNPYMEKEKLLLETSPDEMILPMMFQDERKELDTSYAGISYKEKMMQKRNHKMGIPPETATKESPSPPPPAAAAAGQPNIEVSKVEPLPSPVNEIPAAPSSPQSPIATSEPPRVEPPKVEPSPPVPVNEEPVTPRPRPRVPPATGDFHKDTRTLMGLTLKHRGGPGFGSGRLQGEEIERYEELASNLMDTLRREKPTITAAESQTNPQPSIQYSSSAPQQEVTNTPDGTKSMVSLIEGAVQLYKNSPPQLQESMLGAVRAALLSAVDTCNKILGNEEKQDFLPMGSSSVSNSDRAASMIACVEGATLMYKNSPNELQSAVLPTLRSALLSAIASCNAIIDNKVEIVAPSEQTSAPSEQTFAADPITVPEQLENTFEDEVEAPVVATAPEPSQYVNEENLEILEEIYAKLKRASGDGKMGLRKDLSPEEADKLAGDLAEMRVLLVDELNGVSSTAPSSSPKDAQPSVEPLNPSISKYQELLAKAKASKESKEQ